MDSCQWIPVSSSRYTRKRKHMSILRSNVVLIYDVAEGVWIWIIYDFWKRL